MAHLLSGNGGMSIELAGDPYTEQIPFRHESLYVPRRRPFEAPKIADIFPQVRQLLLDGKYHEAAQLGYQKWHEAPTRPGGMGFGGRRGILDASGVPEKRVGQGLSSHG